jgi:hypothetical protein
VQLIFGVLLVAAGGLLILGGRISLLSIGLVVSGMARAGSAFASERGTSALKAEARRQMAALAAEDPRARCALHQDFASIGSCPRCGSFCCARCTPARGFAAGNVCMQCQVLPEVQTQRQKSAARQAALILLIPPLVLVFFVGFELSFTTSSPELTLVLATVGIGAAPWLGLAAVQANVRNGWPLVVSVIPWLMVEILLARGNAGIQSALWLVPLGAAFYAWANVRQAGQLEEALVVEGNRP